MGVQNQPDLADTKWQASIGYRYLYTNKFWIGTEQRDDLGPGDQPVHINIHSYNLNLAYSAGSRLRLRLGLPFQYGSIAFTQADKKEHTYNTGGLGDITLSGEYWLSDPATAPRVLASVGLGVKAPTGSDATRGEFYDPVTGTLQQGTIDQANQLGDGAWGIIVEGQGTAKITGPVYAYASGFYMLSTKQRSDIPFGNNPCTAEACPPATVFRSVPDVYSARAGGGLQLPFFDGLFVNVGGRIDGIPRRNLIGGGDLSFRRPGYTIYLDPGLTLTRGSQTVSFGFPVRLHQNRLQSLQEEASGTFGGGDFADYLVVASYGLRF